MRLWSLDYSWQAGGFFFLFTSGDTIHTIKGNLLVVDVEATIANDASVDVCGGGYDVEGASVEVRDGENNLIGTATTGTNKQADVPGACEVDFTVNDVPEVAFYKITVGTHDGPSYTLAEMQRSNWKVSLTLGG